MFLFIIRDALFSKFTLRTITEQIPIFLLNYFEASPQGIATGVLFIRYKGSCFSKDLN